ncbi:acyltransferase family protein [Acidipila rosea]|uniref:Peptidoglycan/LPS O-acetylase OafA/YrhL n=1 Tax=Acidipila rosea TaxID=768535 RepID=A0A4R1LDY5_9BACT|nr:acyltransferase [Acidipila rosea]TCK75033.1 peptidoglycan/LPS O-acetylase OafA/YrhL [Acidipila rosea]
MAAAERGSVISVDGVSTQASAPILPNLRRHIPALDGMRGFAAIGVVFFHYKTGHHFNHAWLNLITWIMGLGWMGVPLFFALSGFLITGILHDSFSKANWWRKFYLKRSFRIFPLYYLTLALILAADVGVGRMKAAGQTLWIYALYLQNLPSLYHRLSEFPSYLSTVHLWSLAVEEQFYLIWPIPLFLAWRRSRALQLCAIVFMLSFMARIACVALHCPMIVYFSFSPLRIGELCAGGFLALALRQGDALTRMISNVAPYIAGASILALSGVIFWAGTEDRTAPMISIGLTALSCLAVCLIYYCLHPGPLQRLFSNRILRWFGKISYGLYVYHMLFRPVYIRIVNRYLPHSSHGLQYLALISIAFTLSPLLAAASFYTYESYFLHIKERVSALGESRVAS